MKYFKSEEECLVGRCGVVCYTFKKVSEVHCDVPEHGGSKHLTNSSKLLTDYKA
jgi:hypothetical protein